MKLIKSFLTILAAAALAAGCVPEQVIPSLPEFKPEQSYLGIPYEGGVASTTIKATTQWSFDESSIPEWLTVTPHSGGAEVNGIVFAADKNTAASDRTANLRVNVGGKQQRFTVVQGGPGAFEAPLSTIAQVAAGSDGEVFRIRATVTGIRNTLQVSLDVQNVSNLFNSRWGVTKGFNPDVPNASGNAKILKYERTDPDGVPVFSTMVDSGVKTWDYQHTLSNCWYMQIGIKYLFN